MASFKIQKPTIFLLFVFSVNFGWTKAQGICYQSFDPREVEQLRNEIQLQNRRINQLINHLVEGKSITRELFCLAGLKSGAIADSQITASSFFNGLPGTWPPHIARLDGPRGWAAGISLQTHPGEWIQVDFQQPREIYGIVTQGRQDAAEWITGFRIMYGDSEDNLNTITNSNGTPKVFSGNRNQNSHVFNLFPSPITARYFRLVVVTFHRFIGLRMDYLLC